MREPDYLYECADHSYVMYEYYRWWWVHTVLECANERCSWVGFDQKHFRWFVF